jgi:hypothetical protein
MFCQYHIIFHASCSHFASHNAGHKLPNCSEYQGWTVAYQEDKCSSCVEQFSHLDCKTFELIPPSNNQLYTVKALAHHLEATHLQVPTTEWVKLDTELKESLERTFLRVPQKDSLKRDAEIAIMLYLKTYASANSNAKQNMDR